MFTKLASIRQLRVAGLALGAVAVAGAAVVVTASAAGMSFGFHPSTSAPPAADVEAATTSTACQSFVQHFATEIGKSQDQVNAAFQKAIADTLADEVKSGKLTQAQADAIKAKLAGKTPCALPAGIGRPGGGKNPALGAYMNAYLAAAAGALGVSQSQLQADIKGGQSLSQVAAAQHVSEATFRTKLIANLKPTLDQAVKNGKLTSAQEQRLVNALQNGPLPLWNMPARHPKPGAPPASPTASPSTTTT
jgi:hypothetical protein